MLLLCCASFSSSEKRFFAGIFTCLLSGIILIMLFKEKGYFEQCDISVCVTLQILQAVFSVLVIL